MLGNLRERDQLKSTTEQDRTLRTRGSASEKGLHDFRLRVRPWPEARRLAELSAECSAQVAVNTDSCTAPARTGPPGRTAPITSPGIEEDAGAAPSRDGARRPRCAEEPEWTTASCGVFAVRVRRLRGVASHQHVAGLEQHALALQDRKSEFNHP